MRLRRRRRGSAQARRSGAAQLHNSQIFLHDAALAQACAADYACAASARQRMRAACVCACACAHQRGWGQHRNTPPTAQTPVRVTRIEQSVVAPMEARGPGSIHRCGSSSGSSPGRPSPYSGGGRGRGRGRGRYGRSRGGGRFDRVRMRQWSLGCAIHNPSLL